MKVSTCLCEFMRRYVSANVFIGFCMLRARNYRKCRNFKSLKFKDEFKCKRGWPNRIKHDSQEVR